MLDAGSACRLAEVSATALGFLEVPDGRVSKLHCMILNDSKAGLPLPGRTWAQAVIEDQSANGTFLNGKRLAKGEQVPLRHGDRLSVVLSLSPMLERSFTVNFGLPLLLTRGIQWSLNSVAFL